MPDIACGGQIFDIAFHPTQSTVYTGLITGEIKAFGYDEQCNYETNFALRPSKRSCRSLEISLNGDHLWAAGKGKSLQYVSITLAVHRSDSYNLSQSAPSTLTPGKYPKSVKTHTSKLRSNIDILIYYF